MFNFLMCELQYHYNQGKTIRVIMNLGKTSGVEFWRVLYSNAYNISTHKNCNFNIFLYEGMLTKLHVH